MIPTPTPLTSLPLSFFDPRRSSPLSFETLAPALFGDAGDQKQLPVRHKSRFIPELRLADKATLPAWKKAPLSDRTVIINYCDLATRRLLGSHKVRALRRRLGNRVTPILAAVGRDELLDDLRIEKYHETALRLGADWVVSPDDYIYEADSKYAFYQDAHFSRAIKRALSLAKLAKGHYGIIALAIGRTPLHLKEFVTVMTEYAVEAFAFACGDVLKQGKNPRRTILEIREFLDFLRSMKLRSLLLGIDSARFVRMLNPDSYSSSEWSIDASHRRFYTKDGRRRQGSKPTCRHPICVSGILKGTELLAVHNLIVYSEILSNERIS